MKLKLLLGLFFIVWRSTSAEEYTNHWRASEGIANIEFCSHDGYQTTQCVCDVDYNGNFCLNRKCRNFGYNGQNFPTKVDRCLCPPGFLGRNCEPVSCVPGKYQVYKSLKNEKSISLLVSYNTKMQGTWGTDDIGELICNKKEYTRSFNYNYENANYNSKSGESVETCFDNVKLFLSADECIDDDNNPIACQPLDIVNLDSLVQNSPPNSIVFVVTNMNLTSMSDSLSENIIATSIARRIQINVLVYNNTGFLANDPGLDYLSNIASATFGTFVLPSIKLVNEQYNIVNTLLENWDQGNQVSAVFTDEVKTLPVDNTLDMYIAAQLDYGSGLTINGDPDVVVSTDFWKLYKLPAMSLGAAVLSVSGQTANTPVLVYSSGGLKAYSAFTSDSPGDVMVDAAYSVSVVGTSYSLVVRLENGNSALDFATGARIMGTPNSIQLGSQFYNRSWCQFNYMIDATCNSVGASIVTLVTGDHRRSVSFPVYCANFSYASTIYNNLHVETVEIPHLENRQSLTSDMTCGTEIQHEQNGGRSFVIIAENSRDTDNETKSSVDNVFRNKNSIFYQLSSYVNSDSRYSNFFAALNTGETFDKLQSSKYEIFLTKVMGATSDSSPPGPIDVPVKVKNLLLDTIQNTNPYSDIFFVINYNVSVSDDDVMDIQSALAVQRSKLFVFFIQTYTTYPNDVYYQLNKLAISTGGVTVRLNSYDDLTRFFSQYYPILVSNDIVAKSYSENLKPGIALNNVNLLSQTYYLLVTNQDSTGDGIVTASVSVDGITTTSLATIGELQLFSLTPDTPKVYNIPIVFSTSGLAQFSNAVLLANTNSSDFISLSFIDKNGKNRNDVKYNDGAYIPVFYSSSLFNLSSTVSVTYSDAANPAKPVYNGSITKFDSCDGFSNYNWTTTLNWVCSVSGGLYHFKIDRDFNGAVISRTFPIRCVGSDSGDCLNGGTPADDGKCVCTLEWTGDKCQTPQCLNGGTPTDADTCDCLPAFEGLFCEKSLGNCNNSPPSPDYRADLSSLVFVVDVNALAVGGMTADFGVTGVPITVVLYGDGNSPRIVHSATNSEQLLSVLGSITSTTPSTTASSAPTNSDMYTALNLALDNQLTNRAFIVTYTSNADVPVDSDFLIRLAAKRAELRVLSVSGTESNNSKTLSLVGNGIPFAVSSSSDFQSYLTKYIGPLFQSLQYVASSLPQPVFNVFTTGQLTGETTISIPKDPAFDNAMTTVFVHSYKGYVDGGQIGDNSIYTTSFKSSDGIDIKINQFTSGVNGYYAVEVVNYLKTAYLFNLNNTNGQNETMNAGVVYNQENFLHINTAPFYEVATSNPTNFPYLSIKEILGDGSLSDPKSVLFTKKDGPSCIFRYFTPLDVCAQKTTIGYQVQLTTRASATINRQQQFVLTCFQSTYQNRDTTCRGHGSPKNICDCDSNYGGIDCTEPVCVNRGVRDMSVCRCPVDTYGLHCENDFGTAPTTLSTSTVAIVTSTQTPRTSVTSSDSTSNGPSSVPTVPTTILTTQSTTLTTTAPKEIRAVAFILDVIGNDAFAYNQTTKSVLEYVKAFGFSHYVALVSNLNGNGNMTFNFTIYNDEQSLTNKLNWFFNIRSTASRTSNVTLALTHIRDFYNQYGTLFNNAVSMNIFYLTQIGLNDGDNSAGSMGGLEVFTKSAIAYSSFSKSVDPSVVDSLKNFTNDVSSARDFYSGLIPMITSTNSNSSAVLPDKPPTLSCVYGLQSNIRVAIDRSLPSSPDIDTSLNTFLVNFRLAFNFIENDEARCADPSLPLFYNDRTTLTGFPYYDMYVRTSTFCPSQYTAMISLTATGQNSAPTFSDKLIRAIGRNLNSADCSCNRYSDTETMKFVIWLPRAPGPVTDNYLGNLTLTTTNAYHFVVPFYDITEASKATDLYYQILTKQTNGGDYYLLPNAAKAANIQTDIIDKLYEKLCETSGVDPTAVPPELFESGSENRHNDYYY